MTKKGRVAQEGKKRLKKQLMVISIIIAFIIVLGSVLSSWLLQTPEVNFSLSAAIIDQLGEGGFLNSTFVENVTSILKNYNFTVYYYNKSLNVDFFKGLAKNNYGIIILRVHSALREDNSTVDLFTSEEFVEANIDKHRWELDNWLLTPANFSYAPGKLYFAVTSHFVENLEGRFPKSIVIAMGCWSLKPGCEQMARAFIGKGAKAYVGWTDEVLPQHTDSETLKLLKLLLTADKPLGDAVLQTSRYTYKVHGSNQTVTTQLKFYPPEANNLKISQLITEVKASMPFQISACVVCSPRPLEFSFNLLKNKKSYFCQERCLLPASSLRAQCRHPTYAITKLNCKKCS